MWMPSYKSTYHTCVLYWILTGQGGRDCMDPYLSLSYNGMTYPRVALNYLPLTLNHFYLYP